MSHRTWKVRVAHFDSYSRCRRSQDHINELDVPLPWRADDESRNAVRPGPRSSFWNRRAIPRSPAMTSCWHRFAIHETSHRKRIAHNHEIGIGDRHDLRRVSQHEFERVRP